MPQVSVSVGGRTYRIACGDGEEDHLTRLAGVLDDRIRAMRTEFGEIGDQRMTVMAAITLADDLSDMRGRLTAAEAELAALAAARHDHDSRTQAVGRAVADALDTMTTALDDVTARLAGSRAD